MATEEILVKGGLTIVFAAGVAWGITKSMIYNLRDADKALKERIDKIEKDDCDDIVRKYLFDEAALPRFMPISQCAKQHIQFADQLSKMETRSEERLDKMESQIEIRQRDIMEALAKIHYDVKQGG